MCVCIYIYIMYIVLSAGRNPQTIGFKNMLPLDSFWAPVLDQAGERQKCAKERAEANSA